jgi:diaminopimelate decarboxylase
VATGQEDSKFGLGPADARRRIERLRGSDRLRLDGLHDHIGSQILDARAFRRRQVAALAALGEFARLRPRRRPRARYTTTTGPRASASTLDVLVGAAREHLRCERPARRSSRAQPRRARRA